MIIFFPVSAFFAIEKNAGFLVSSEKGKIAEERTDNSIGQIMGTEKNITKSAENKIPEYKPIRKEGISDLAVPNAHSSLILDAGSGTILHYNNGKEKRQIASLTKMMTAVLIMEKIKDLDNTVVTVDEEAVYIEGTKIGCPRSGYCISTRLKVGEKIKAKDLLKAMLMNSANDAALALAKHIGATESNFVEMMNEKAKELGLTDTHFCTSSGLEINGRESECYSTAYDIARIAAYSLKYDLIWEIFRLPTNTIITSTDGKCTHDIINTDLILGQVPNCLGGKTGFTPLAGHSLLLAATDPTEKHKIIAVVLDNPYRWQDIKVMIDWTFQSYGWE
jgi:D-alanyl-D-alanine carboxypeptidase